MADFDLYTLAEELGKEITFIAQEVITEVEASIKELAHTAYSSILVGIQDHSTSPEQRKQYEDALSITPIPNGYIITLDAPQASKLEDGQDKFDLKPGMLASTKTVSAGSRAGQPWVQKGAEGQRYARVPFPKKASVLEKPSGNLINDIKQLTAQNLKGRKQKLTRTFKDLSGRPVSGFAASVKPDAATHPHLQGVVKYQTLGKEDRVSSSYIVFRTVSDNSPEESWQHKRKQGFGLFLEAEKYVQQELERIVETLL